MQVIGVAQQGLRLPGQALQGFQHRCLGTYMVGVRVELRVRHNQHLWPGHFQQGPQIGQQVAPGRRAIAVGRQREWVEPAEDANVGEVGLARSGRLVGRSLHGRQLQAEVAQLHATRFRHTGPAWHGDTVPGPQAALKACGFGLCQSHLLIVFGLDLTCGQRHYPGFVGLAVEPVSGQFGVIGMRRDHHHSTPLQLDRRGYPQARPAQQPTMPATQAQRACLQRCGEAGQIEEAHAIDAALEGLPVGLLASHQLDLRVEEAPQPAAFYPQLEDQGVVALQRAFSLEQAAAQGGRNLQGLLAEFVRVVLAWRIEQVVGKPGFMGRPQQRQQQKWQPPPAEHPYGHQRGQAHQQAQALVAPVALEQLLLATHA